MGFNLKNRLNNHLKNVSTQAMPKSRSNVIKTLTDADGAFDVVVDKLDIVPDALGDADKLFNEIKDKFNIQNQSIIGDGTDGDVFAGFCKSVGNDEDGNGLVEFVGDAGVIGAASVVAFSSGAPKAIELATKDITEKTNEKLEKAANFLDSLPQVLGKPGGGFLGAVLKVVGSVGALNQVLGDVSPLAGITDKITTIKDKILDKTGIGGLIDKVNGVIDNATTAITNTLNSVTESITGAVEQALDGITESLEGAAKNAVKDSVGDAAKDTAKKKFSLGGLINDIAEDITQNLTNRVKNLVPNIDENLVPGILSGIAEGGLEKVNALKTVLTEEASFKSLGDKVAPIDAITNAKTFSDTIDAVVNNVTKNGGTAAETAAFRNNAEKIEKELSDNSFNPRLAGLLAAEASSPQGEPFTLDLSKKFTYVSSVEELELEFSSKLLSEASRKIDTVVLHASETFSNKNIGAEEIEATIAKLSPLEAETSIPYHYVIRRDGRLQRGKPVEEEGSHCNDAPNINPTSIGVVMIGGINRASTEQPWETSSSSFTRAQFDTLEQFLSTYYFHFPSGEVLGHSDIEEDELDPYFDVQEYILSLFGKINQSQIDVEETEQLEEFMANQSAEEVVNSLPIEEAQSLFGIAREAIKNGLLNIKTPQELLRTISADVLIGAKNLVDKQNVLRSQIASIESGNLPAPTPASVASSIEDQAGFLDTADNEGQYVLIGMPQTKGYFAGTTTQAEEDALRAKLGVPIGGNPNLHKRVDISELTSDMQKKLRSLANKMEKNLRVNSGYRTKEVNKRVGGVDKSDHIKRIAADISTTGFTINEKKKMLQLALDLGFEGIGTYNTFIHLDIKSRDKVVAWYRPTDGSINIPRARKFAIDVMRINGVGIPDYAQDK